MDLCLNEYIHVFIKLITSMERGGERQREMERERERERDSGIFKSLVLKLLPW